MVQDSPRTEAERKAALHAQLDSMDNAQLTAFERALLSLELKALAAEITAAFEEERREGRMTDEKIQAAIAGHRAKHPYR